MDVVVQQLFIPEEAPAHIPIRAASGIFENREQYLTGRLKDPGGNKVKDSHLELLSQSCLHLDQLGISSCLFIV